MLIAKGLEASRSEKQQPDIPTDLAMNDEDDEICWPALPIN